MGVLPEDQQRSHFGFSFPASFLRVARLNLVNLEPWTLLDSEQMLGRYRDMSLRYPGLSYVPFASRLDMDEVACWVGATAGQGVVIVHDFASPSWEVRRTYDGFYEWLRSAFDDFVDFDH